jgi:hypothetical protein
MNSLLESLADPHARHAMFVHLPIVLGLLGIAPLIALAFTRFTSRGLRVATIAWFLFLSASAGLAAVSGNAAAQGLENGATALAPDDRAAVAVHEQRGERAWIWPLIPAALLAAGTHPRWRTTAGTGAVLAGLGVAIWFGVIAHAGGRLVYARGLGVPVRGTPPVEPATAALPGTP